MKALSTIVIALVATLLVGAQAHAHPNHGPVGWKQLEPEVVAEIEIDGELYSVTNTHMRGFFVGELIQIRDSHGALEHQWWSIHGWCFTAHAYEHQACWSRDGYMAVFKNYLHRGKITVRPYDGSWRTEEATGFCDHYTQLEYDMSGDTSGICGF